MREFVTWMLCPRCGRRAAVGWATDGRSAAAPDRHQPVEFDCANACLLALDELGRALDPASGSQDNDPLEEQRR